MNEVAQTAAIERLKVDKEPVECPRCGGKPGEPGCGKIVHAIMDSYYDREVRMLARKMELWFCIITHRNIVEEQKVNGVRHITLSEREAATWNEAVDLLKELNWELVEHSDVDSGGFLIAIPPEIEKELLEEGEVTRHSADNLATVTITAD